VKSICDNLRPQRFRTASLLSWLAFGLRHSWIKIAYLLINSDKISRLRAVASAPPNGPSGRLQRYMSRPDGHHWPWWVMGGTDGWRVSLRERLDGPSGRDCNKISQPLCNIEGRNHGWKVEGDQGLGPNPSAPRPAKAELGVGCRRGSLPSAVRIRGYHHQKFLWKLIC